MNNGEGKNGFVLLSNILIIGFAALLIGSVLLVLGLPTLRSSVVYQRKTEALALNQSCAEEALFQIRQFPTYTGSANVTLNNRICSYSVTNLGGDNRKVTINSTLDKVVTKTEILLTIDTSSTIAISSWKEVGEF